jgi:hypothetical protein
MKLMIGVNHAVSFTWTVVVTVFDSNTPSVTCSFTV